MSEFSENLQFYRKKEAMTQEQLAEKLEVSRQTVSKWESGTAYPEMEKILQLCQIFSCNMDVLMRQNAEGLSVQDNEKHRNHMQKRRNQYTCAVAMIVSAFAIYEILAGFGVMEAVRDTVFMAVAIVGILILIVQEISHDNYGKKYPVVHDFYTKEEKERFEETYPKRIATGIGLILIGFLIGMNGESLAVGIGIGEDFYYGIFLAMVAAGAGVLTYAGLGKEKYDVEEYNKVHDETRKKLSNKSGIICGCILLTATIIFMVAGLVFHLWHICWLVYPVGAVLCAIVVLILKYKEEQV